MPLFPARLSYLVYFIYRNTSHSLSDYKQDLWLDSVSGGSGLWAQTARGRSAPWPCVRPEQRQDGGVDF